MMSSPAILRRWTKILLVVVFYVDILKTDALIQQYTEQPTAGGLINTTFSSFTEPTIRRNNFGVGIKEFDYRLTYQKIRNVINRGEHVVSNNTNVSYNPTIAKRRTVAGVGMLKVQGRNIVENQTGKTVYLRGVNMDCYYYFDTSLQPEAQLDWYANEGDIQYLKSIKVTAIRLVLHWKYFDSSLGYDLIDQYVQWCSNAGIYIILDMHVVPPDSDFGNELIWGNAGAQVQLINLWKAIASRYKNEVWIAGYDIYNEPRAPNADDWWDLANRIISQGIRTVDTMHIVFVETSTFPDIEFRKLSDTNVVYSYHDYEPFQISHAGVSWGLDEPIPTSYSYPGRVLMDTNWIGYSNQSKPLKGRKTRWTLIDSGNVKPFVYDGFKGPIEWASIRITNYGNTGSVYIDDIQVLKNGIQQPVLNPGFEEQSPSDPSRPRYWQFWSPKATSGSWSSNYYRPSRGSKRSLELRSTIPDTYGEWVNINGYFTKPLFKVSKNDVFRIRGWVLAPKNTNGGEVYIVLDYRSGTYKEYNSTSLREYIQPAIDWAKTQNVPLYVGEFGSTPSARGTSRDNLVRDKIALMNSEGLHWSLWTYRQPEGTVDFGLFTGDVVDTAFETVLKAGLV